MSCRIWASYCPRTRPTVTASVSAARATDAAEMARLASSCVVRQDDRKAREGHLLTSNKMQTNKKQSNKQQRQTNQNLDGCKFGLEVGNVVNEAITERLPLGAFGFHRALHLPRLRRPLYRPGLCGARVGWE